MVVSAAENFTSEFLYKYCILILKIQNLYYSEHNPIYARRLHIINNEIY